MDEHIQFVLTCPECGGKKFTKVDADNYRCVNCGALAAPEEMGTASGKVCSVDVNEDGSVVCKNDAGDVILEFTEEESSLIYAAIESSYRRSDAVTYLRNKVEKGTLSEAALDDEAFIKAFTKCYEQALYSNDSLSGAEECLPYYACLEMAQGDCVRLFAKYQSYGMKLEDQAFYSSKPYLEHLEGMLLRAWLLGKIVAHETSSLVKYEIDGLMASQLKFGLALAQMSPREILSRMAEKIRKCASSDDDIKATLFALEEACLGTKIPAEEFLAFCEQSDITDEALLNAVREACAHAKIVDGRNVVNAKRPDAIPDYVWEALFGIDF